VYVFVRAAGDFAGSVWWRCVTACLETGASTAANLAVLSKRRCQPVVLKHWRQHHTSRGNRLATKRISAIGTVGGLHAAL